MPPILFSTGCSCRTPPGCRLKRSAHAENCTVFFTDVFKQATVPSRWRTLFFVHKNAFIATMYKKKMPWRKVLVYRHWRWSIQCWSGKKWIIFRFREGSETYCYDITRGKKIRIHKIVKELDTIIIGAASRFSRAKIDEISIAFHCVSRAVKLLNGLINYNYYK